MSKKMRRHDEASYIDLLHQTINSAEATDDPLDNQILEEEMILDEYEQQDTKEELDGYDAGQYEISTEARSDQKDGEDDSDDEIRITLKRKRPKVVRENTGAARDKSSFSEVITMLKNIENRLTAIERWVKPLGMAGGSSSARSFHNLSISNVTRFLPMKTIDEVKDFNEMLDDPEFEESFIAMTQNAELKDLMEDTLIMQFNYGGIHKKQALKEHKFFQIWKDNCNLAEIDFIKNIKLEVTAAHNRHHSRLCRARAKKAADTKSHKSK
ncbi:hypothetical protein DMENIID0001_113080 [Sergentomyia squamirostris]